MEEIQALHEKWKLGGEPANALLKAPPELLSYLLGILSARPQVPPPFPEDQWERFFAILDGHRVIPLLFHLLHSAPPRFHPPSSVMEQMRLVFLAHRARAWRVDRRLAEIVGALGGGGVSFLVWKGPALARSFYPDVALRPSDDIDILVPSGQYRRARAVFQELGFQSEAPHFEGQKEYGYSETLHRFDASGEKQVVDLLWHLHPYAGARGQRNLENLFERARLIRYRNLSFYTPDPVEALITAALHMTLQHPQEIRLIWIYDVAILARALSSPGQWEELQHLSVQWNARLAVENVLTMARLWTGVEAPSPFRDFSTWPVPNRRDRAVFDDALRSRVRRASLFRLYWPGSGAPREKLRFLLRLIFPHPSYVCWKYPVTSPVQLPASYLKCWLGWGRGVRRLGRKPDLQERRNPL